MKKILAVDADKELLRSLRLLLESEGYQVATATDHPQALALVQADPPDLILMDLGRYPEAGYAACRSLKEFAPTTPVILMTGASLSQADRELGFQAGADGFIPKPQDFPEIVEYIGEKIAAAASRKEVPKLIPEYSLVACPDCKAKFKVAERQLKVAKGKLKCPRCEYVFVPRPERVEKVPLAPSVGPKEERAGKRVLVVEDTEFFRTYVAEILDDAGYRVLAARDGSEALSLLQKERVDLVLTDLLLPGLHGFDLCKKIKEMKVSPPIKVIMMTGVYKSIHYQMEGRWKYGADDFILKPFEAQDLLTKIDDLILFKKGEGKGGGSA